MASPPVVKSRKPWVALGLGALVIFVGCHGLAKMDYFCSECATDRTALQLCLPKNRVVLTIYSMETPSQATAIKRSVEPGRCDHRWVFAAGRGGWFIRAEGAESRRTRLRQLDNQGLVASAARVDAPGCLEFIRWALRTDMPEEAFRESCLPPDGRGVTFDSESSFRAWFDELRKKAGGRAQT